MYKRQELYEMKCYLFSSIGLFVSHCSMIGPQTGQVINYAVRSKDCRACTTAASKNQQVRDHACSKNWDGSSKAMEADMVIEMVREVHEKGDNIDAIKGDEDSTTIGRLRANVNDNIVNAFS